MARVSIAESDSRQTRLDSPGLADIRNVMRTLDERLGAAIDALDAAPLSEAEGVRSKQAALAVRDVVDEIVWLWTDAGLAAGGGFRSALLHATGADATAERSHSDDATGAALDMGLGANPLTAREQEVAGLVAEGLRNAEIADRLFISKRTVESHVDSVKLKLGLRTRHQVIAWVLRGVYTRRQTCGPHTRRWSPTARHAMPGGAVA